VAYIADTRETFSEEDSTNFSVELPPHSADDLLLVVVGTDNDDLSSFTSGWNNPSTGGNVGGGQSHVFWKLAANSSESLDLVTASTTDFVVCSVTVSDVDTTTPVEVFAENIMGANGTNVDTPGVTASAGALVIRAVGGFERGTGFFDDLDLFSFSYSSTEVRAVSLACEVAPAAQAMGTRRWSFSRNERGTGYTLSIQNAAGGSIQAIPTFPWSPHRRLGQWGEFYDGDTFVGISADITEAFGLTVSTRAPSLLNSGQVEPDPELTDYDFVWTSFVFAADTNQWQGLTVPVSLDLTDGSIMSVFLDTSNGGNSQGSEGIFLALIDASGNYVIYRRRKVEGINDTDDVYFFTQNSVPDESSGAFDWSDITKVGYARHRGGGSSTNTISICNIATHQPMVVKGGDSQKPVSYSDLFGYFRSNFFVLNCLRQGEAQFQSQLPVQIGDGTTETHFSARGNSWELPGVFGVSQFSWRLAPGDYTFAINASPNDVIDLSASIMGTASRQLFEIVGTSSLSAEYRMTGLLIRGWDVTVRDGIPLTSVIFSGCFDLAMGAANLDRCEISAPQASSAITVSAGASVVDCSFDAGGNSAAVGATLESAGSYDFSNSTFSGFATDIDVTATAGTVTITLAQGQSQPTSATAGATVVFVQPQVQLTLTGIQPASEVRIYDSTTEVEIAGQEQVNTGSFATAIPSTTSAVDVVVHSLNYEYLRLDDLPVLENATIPIVQRLDRQYINP